MRCVHTKIPVDVTSRIEKERIAFAATKGWTSVRRTYFSVEDSQPERQAEPLTETLGVAVSSRTGQQRMVFVQYLPNIIRELRRTFSIGAANSDHADLSVRLGKNHGSHLLFSLHFTLL
jgi:hypothetical protein